MSKVREKSPKKRRGLSLKQKETRLALFFLAPTALIVFGLVLFPAIFSIWISFHQVGLRDLRNVFAADFVGLQNFARVVDDFAFKPQGWQNWGAAVNSVVYSFASTILTVLLGLIAALLLNQPFKGRGVTRAIFLAPYVAPIVSVAFVWKWLLDARPSGVLNDVLLSLGLIDAPRAYLATRGLALFLVIIFQGWRYFPFAMLMILARLQAIDEALYEVATVAGATVWQKFWYVTLPSLRYVLGSLFLLRLIWTFNKFDDIWLLTGGGYGTNVLPVLTYQFSFRSYDFGKGAANAMILLVILVLFLVAYVSIVMRDTDEA